jgi:oligosaccharyltransferase complex subunit delta (ribophorin II)
LLHVISLEDAYEALRVFEILAIQKKPLDTADTCKKVLENLGSSSSSPLKDVFYALKVNGVLKCNVDAAIFKVLILCFFHGHYCYCFVAHLVWLLLVC